MSLVSTNWLQENLDNVKIIDCSWHMPKTKRDGFDEYQKKHIKNSIFFDLDKNSKQNINLPHMLVSSDEWRKIVSEMGIKNNDLFIALKSKRDGNDFIISAIEKGAKAAIINKVPIGLPTNFPYILVN